MISRPNKDSHDLLLNANDRMKLPMPFSCNFFLPPLPCFIGSASSGVKASSPCVFRIPTHLSIYRIDEGFHGSVFVLGGLASSFFILFIFRLLFLVSWFGSVWSGLVVRD